MPSAVPKTVRPCSCVIQLFTVRDKSSLSFLQDDLGKSISKGISCFICYAPPSVVDPFSAVCPLSSQNLVFVNDMQISISQSEADVGKSFRKQNKQAKAKVGARREQKSATHGP